MNAVERQAKRAELDMRVDALVKGAGSEWLREPAGGGNDVWKPFNGAGINDNRWSGQPRYGRDALQAMRDVNALEAAALGPLGFVREMGGHEMKEPQGLAIAANGDVWVVDKGHHLIKRFSSGGDFISEFGGLGAGDGQFNRPSGIAIDADGNLYVVDTFNYRVQKFDSGGSFLLKWGTVILLDEFRRVGLLDGRFPGIPFTTGPEHIAIGGDGNVYVPDGWAISGHDERVQIFSPSGAFIDAVRGLEGPTAIAFDSAGDFYVAMLSGSGPAPDFLPGRVWKFSSGGTFLFNFVEDGSGDGESKRITGMAVDSNGDIYMTDRSGGAPLFLEHRVQVFNSIGNFLRNFGSRGEGAGDFSSPAGIVIGSDDEPYITDGELLLSPLALRRFENNGRVQKLTSTGAESDVPEFWFSFGNGLFQSPTGAAINASDNVYVADATLHRVQKFKSDDTLLLEFGEESSDFNPFNVPLDSDNGKFNTPRHMAVAPNGNISVVDSLNGRVEIFNANGNFLSKFGEGALGTVGILVALVVDSNGNTYVIEEPSAAPAAIHKYDPDGKFLFRFGAPVTGSLPNPYSDLAIDKNDDSIYMAESSLDNGTLAKIHKFDTDGNHLFSFGSIGAKPVDPGEFHFRIGGIDVDHNGDIYAGNPFAGVSSSRLDIFDSTGASVVQIRFVGSALFAEKTAVDASRNFYLSTGAQIIKYKRASGGVDLWTISFGRVEAMRVIQDELYVVSRDDDLIRVYDLSSGDFIREWGASGSDDGQFDGPHGIAEDAQGNVRVTDNGNKRIQVFDTDGNFLSKIDNAGRFFLPWGIAIDANGNTFVSDATLAKIVKYDSDQEFLLEFGTPGAGEGQFDSPRGLAIDSTGKLYVVDTGNSRIQVFSAAGVFLFEFGSPGSGDGQFDDPEGIDIDASDIVYVTDTGNKRIQSFSIDGDFIQEFGRGGEIVAPPNHGTMDDPVDVALNSIGDIHVVDNDYNRVNIYGRRAKENNQTLWSKWTRAGKVSLGIPDGGVSVPSLTALDGASNFVAPETLDQMRSPIKSLTEDYVNVITGNAFDWANLSAENLYLVALGSRDTEPSDFGFDEPSPAYDWQRDLDAMRNTSTFDIDMGEIGLVIDLLEASTPA